MLWLACFDPVISPFPVKCVTKNSHPAPGQSDTHEDSVWHCLSLSPELFAGPAQDESVLKLIRTPLSVSLLGYMIHPKRSSQQEANVPQTLLIKQCKFIPYYTVLSQQICRPSYSSPLHSGASPKDTTLNNY